MENDTLDGWVEKYKHYSGYPIIGKVRIHRPPPLGLFNLRPVAGFWPVAR